MHPTDITMRRVWDTTYVHPPQHNALAAMYRGETDIELPLLYQDLYYTWKNVIFAVVNKNCWKYLQPKDTTEKIQHIAYPLSPGVHTIFFPKMCNDVYYKNKIRTNFEI